MLKHITVATMDRLLLPELLPHLDRVIYHDLDALSVVDLAELYDADLGGAPAGGPPVDLVQLPARHRERHPVDAGCSGHDPGAARDLVRAMTQRHRYGYHGFNAGILLLDLAVMRADRFTARVRAVRRAVRAERPGRAQRLRGVALPPAGRAVERLAHAGGRRRTRR